MNKRVKRHLVIIRLAKGFNGSFTWFCDEPELISYAIRIGELWLLRELMKGYATADILNKACGILSEEIFAAELNQVNVQHVRTMPLLHKNHPVNKGKPYDFKINDLTIDIKSIPPIPPPSGHHTNLNVNKAEIENRGPCDIYVVTKCYPELPSKESPKISDIKAGKEWAKNILRQVERVEFLGWAYKDELIKDENLVRTKKPFYSLSPPFHLMMEFAMKFNIPI